MSNFSIAVIPGDGIGREVTPVALAIAQKAAAKYGDTLEPKCFDWGSDYYLKHGRMMPPDGVDQLRKFDAILLGAVGHRDVSDHVTLNGLLLPIRRELDLFANVRPCILYAGVESPLRHISAGEVDIVVVRENTEGEYSQVGGFVHKNQLAEVAVQTAVFTRRGVERIIRFAFELAQRRNQRRKVTSVTKSNAQGFSMVLWDRVFAEVASEYDGVETESVLVDAAALNFVRRPQTFDVVVASNLFGDILSDVAAMVTGGLGLAASANIDPLRRAPSMFEPVHGTAPDIAGQGIANPLGSVFSAVMMLDHLGLLEAAKSVDAAAQALISEGKIRTPDLGGTNTTAEMAEAVMQKLE